MTDDIGIPENLKEAQQVINSWQLDAIPNAEPFDQAAHSANEASEVLDVYVKSKQYGQRLDRKHVAEEIGDTVVALMYLCQMEDLSMHECIEMAMDDNLDVESDGGPPQ